MRSTKLRRKLRTMFATGWKSPAFAAGCKAAAFVVPLFLFTVADAFASNSGVAPIDAMSAKWISFIQGIAPFGAAILIGFGIWEALGHKQLARWGTEIAVGVAIAIVSANANAVLTFLGMAAATF